MAIELTTIKKVHSERFLLFSSPFTPVDATRNNKNEEVRARRKAGKEKRALKIRRKGTKKKKEPRMYSPTGMGLGYSMTRKEKKAREETTERIPAEEKKVKTS